MDKLDKLMEKMKESAILPRLTLEHAEIEVALDQRDDPRFGENWMNAFREVESKKGGNQDAEVRVGQLREMAYLQAFERWQSPDLAAYISDDFGLIGDALATGYENPWLNQLLHAYLRHRFPRGYLEECGGQLGDAL